VSPPTIHDDSAQALSAVRLRLDALADASSGLDRELLAEGRTSIRLATERLRRLLFELRPPVLDEAGLAAALDSYLPGPRSRTASHTT
jgi:signal transduction histidine kinase